MKTITEIQEIFKDYFGNVPYSGPNFIAFLNEIGVKIEEPIKVTKDQVVKALALFAGEEAPYSDFLKELGFKD